MLGHPANLTTWLHISQRIKWQVEYKDMRFSWIDKLIQTLRHITLLQTCSNKEGKHFYWNVTDRNIDRQSDRQTDIFISGM